MAKVGLVLSGGGARGLAHIGVLKALETMNVRFDAIAGCSAGAVIGALYAAGRTANEIEDFVLNRGLYKDFKFSFRRFALHGHEKFQKRFEDCMNVRSFEKLRIPLYVNATNITRGREKVFSKGQIFPAIRASISIPGIFTPAKIGNDYYVDGGILDQHPFSILPKDITHYVIVNASPYFHLRKEKEMTRVNLLEMSISMMQTEMTVLRLSDLNQDRVVVVEPHVERYRILETQKKFPEIIRKGKLAGTRKRGEIEKNVVNHFPRIFDHSDR